MDDRDLQLLRRFRQSDAEPPAGLRPRIEEQLWRLVLEEERSAARRRGARTARPRRWYEGLLRPAVAAGAAASLAAVVALSGDGGAGPSATPANEIPVRQAGVLDSTARALFGDSAGGATSRAPIAGTIDLTSSGRDDEVLARGPRLDDSGQLDEASRDFVRQAPRDPRLLQARLRAGAADAVGADPTDRVAFQLAMQWVAQPQVPSELRAAMLRALDGMSGVDPALVGADLLGREAFVLGHVDLRSGVRDQYLLLAQDGRLLERRSYTTSYVDPACPPGTFTQHALLDDKGTVVQPADAPWLDWPIVVPACDPGPAGS